MSLRILSVESFKDSLQILSNPEASRLLRALMVFPNSFILKGLFNSSFCLFKLMFSGISSSNSQCFLVYLHLIHNVFWHIFI